MSFGKRISQPFAFLVWLILLSVSPVAADTGMEGTWKGVMIIHEAQFELDLVLDIERKGESWMGYLSVPTRDVERRPVENLVIQGSALSFLYRDEAGGSRFSGTRDLDGKAIVGQITEGTNSFSTRFERLSSKVPQDPPLVHTVGEDGAELKSLFNQHRDAVRLVMVLSPT